ncbi:hypothetical protein BGZ70_004555 [Mortierella alpina]|uniref:Zn(2)-C6 fungal-type domain-containing protein n=1 Tax=Mortierella alpina TaxID=64518 RepID=A0A9P6LUD3_MORAP|nr:hypothetical protein BGZ70_004555 [Mortierella alpina]
MRPDLLRFSFYICTSFHCSKDSESFARARTPADRDSFSPSPSPSKPTGVPSASSLSASRGGARGPVGPRPGVYRPCARCRVKKTKCDKAKPSCSNCQRGGSDLICVYDNDEPTDGVITATHSTQVVSASTLTKENGTKQIKGSARKESAKPSASATVTNTSALVTELERPGPGKEMSRDQSNKSNKSSVDSRSKSHHGGSKPEPMQNAVGLSDRKLPSSSDTVPGQPALKKTKTRTTASEANIPSPLRAYISTDTDTQTRRSPPLPGSKGAGSKRKISISHESNSASKHYSEEAWHDKDALEDKKGDRVVSELTVLDALDQGAESSAPGTPLLKPKSSDLSSRLKKTPASSQNNPSKIIIDLASKPAQTFIIDKNQKARKWGKSSNIFQTLGGEVTLPIWTSDQEMLLNERRPVLVQRQIPLMTGRKDSNLARLAVLNQMDFEFDTPERGNTPDSEGSPAPTTPPVKKKRMFKKNASGGGASTTTAPNGSAKRNGEPVMTKHGNKGSKRSRADSGNSEENQDDALTTAASSARSTPAPTAAPARGGILQRPRTFACSFEGCGKSFMDKFHLDRHEARHVTDEILCGIDGCTKAYNSISTVRRHQSIVHKDRKEEMDLLNQKSNSTPTAGHLSKPKTKSAAARFSTASQNISPVDTPGRVERSESPTRTASPFEEQRQSFQREDSAEDVTSLKNR